MNLVLERFSRIVTIERRGTSTPDEYGTPSGGTVTTEEIVGHVRPLSSDELPDGVSGTRWKLYVGPEVSLSASERVTIDGDVFEVVTVPVERFNPRSRLVEAIECQIEARA